MVREDFVLKIPAGLRPEVAAPILCAGVTTYSPFKHWGVKAGDKVGIIGFGGLGNMAAKIARAMGAEVTIFTRTEEKLDEAAKLGSPVCWRAIPRHSSAALISCSAPSRKSTTSIPT